MLSAPLFHLALDDNIAVEDGDFLAAFYRLDAQADWRLSFSNGVYTLDNRAQKLSMTLDFRIGSYRHRQQYPSKEPLVKAVKIKKKLPQTLIDATPGVLKDSLMLASRGVQITAVERNPLLFVMVRQALSVLPETSNITYDFGDACEKLREYTAAVIYLDPMYPEKKNGKKNEKKQAKVKKDMQILHQIVGEDADADQLLLVARQQPSRVVVKRPRYAEPLAGEQPDFEAKMGATRFDVYLPR